MTPFLLLPDVAETLRVSRGELHALIRSGQLRVLRLDLGFWRVEAAELAAYLRRDVPPPELPGPVLSVPRPRVPRMTAPAATRPTVPDGYGVPETTAGLLRWADVELRLVAARHVWLASVRPDGTPHTVPRWGVWLDGRFFYDGSPTTRHVRNVESNPWVSLHLESGTEVVIVEGRSEATHADRRLGVRLSRAFSKYAELGYAPEPDAWAGPDGGGLRVLTPHRALAWFAFPEDCTRFTFGADS